MLFWAKVAALAFVVTAELPGNDEPVALPSGLDLLYGDRIALAPSGEPIVAVGLANNEKLVRLRAHAPIELDFWEAGVPKRATVKTGDAISITVARATLAKRQHYLDLEGVRFGDKAALERALAAWRKRGYGDVTVVEDGLVLGLNGRVLDNREYRVVLNTKSHDEAEKLRQEIFDKHAVRGFVLSRLVERPWAELTVKADKVPLGLATSYVRLSSPLGTIQVDDIEFGRGYAWQGRENRSYHGEIYIVVSADGELAVVNVLPAEQLLEGVVPAEIYASAPHEALKAQAVAARNHLLSQLGRRHHDAPFHVCSEQHCQVYGGASREDPRTSAAVRATFGLALFHGERLVECAYSASCGGHTEDNDAVWGGPKDPALRGRPDFDEGEHPALSPANMEAWIAAIPKSYCAMAAAGKPSRIRWTKHLTADELAKLLADRRARLGSLRDLVVEQRGPGGRIIALKLVGTRGHETVVHELPIRRLFGNLSSGAFVYKIERDPRGAIVAIRFDGAGWGHGVGMCQLGAIGRAETGHTYEQILGHYYNDATVVKLY